MKIHLSNLFLKKFKVKDKLQTIIIFISITLIKKIYREIKSTTDESNYENSDHY